MKIVKLQIENIKKIKAVEIEPKDNMVVISGKNEQGKSTVLDSIWWVLAGMKEVQEQPVRVGETKGKITLDLGDIIATRKFTANGSTLEVTNKEGLKFSSPQAILDKLISRFSFDVQAFAKAEKKSQVETLLGLVNIPLNYAKLKEISGVTIAETVNPLEALNNAYKNVFDARTIINRDLERSSKTLETMTQITPVEPVSTVDLVAEKTVYENKNRENDTKRKKIIVYQNDVTMCKKKMEKKVEEIDQLNKQISELNQRLEAAKNEKENLLSDLTACVDKKDEYQKVIDQLIDIDLTEINSKIAAVDETNRHAHAYKVYCERKREKELFETESAAQTQKLEAIKNYKEELMKQVKFPVDGLGFREGGVTLNDIPFSQLSGAQKLQISTAIGMAINPGLKVLRINDGNQLDSAHLEVIKKLAQDKDYQVWMEYVDESGKIGFLIEDGEVKRGLGL